ncbi:MBL fold metallo-hydrolase [Clostridium paraputrificum]|uniref:MBL fold metallo-hydrolase n=1 Tax=Clostridium paraputrificum TaxID=29363 RepID=UPI003D33C672
MFNKITDRVYYMDFKKESDRPVLGLVVGDNYSLVVDGGNSKAHAEEFLGYVAKLNVPPLKYLALTHWHWDHVFGITTMNLINIIGEKSNRKLKWMKGLEWTDKAIDERVESGEEIEFCREHIKVELPSNDRYVEIPSADIVFKNFIEVDLGGVIVNIEHIDCDHSEDSVIVNIPGEKVTFLGDSLYMDMYRGEWSYSREKFYKLLEKLEDYKSKYYIPAHHELYDFKGFRDFVRYEKSIGDIVGSSISLEESLLNFEKINNKRATEDEKEDLAAFVEGNKKNLTTKI